MFILVSSDFNSVAQNKYQGRDTIIMNNFLQLVEYANAATEKGDWKTASAQWEIITRQNPTVGEYWYKLGESYYYSKQPGRAIEPFIQCMTIGAASSHEPFDCAYFIAKCYAKNADKNNSLYWLQKSFDLGYRDLMSVRVDSSFASYFGEIRFNDIIGLPRNEFRNKAEGWRFDLRLVAREIKRRGPDPFRRVSERQFDSAVLALDKQIPFLSDIQVITRLMKIMTLAGDGHTMIYGFFERPEFLQNLPFELYKFEEGIFITAADYRYKYLLGAQLIAFDETPVEEILKGLEPLVNRDNAQGPSVLGLMRIRTLPLLYGLGLIKNPGEVTLSVKQQTGKLVRINIKADCPIPSRKLWDKLPENWTSYNAGKNINEPLHLKNQYRHYWFEYLPREKTVYFQYNSIADDPGNSFNKFCDSLFVFIGNTYVEKLIIDLRLNNGGNTRLTPYLLDKIIACKKINQRGKLFGIIGRRTYSAAINLCGYLERFTAISFVGEPTGSSPNFIGEDHPFELPYSKLMANVSDHYWQSSWPDDHRQWFSPLIYIPPTFRDFAAGKDPSLDVILSYTKQSQ